MRNLVPPEANPYDKPDNSDMRPSDDKSVEKSYSETLADVAQRTGVSISDSPDANVASRAVQSDVMEANALQRKFPTATAQLTESSSSSIEPIILVGGMIMLAVLILLIRRCSKRNVISVSIMREILVHRVGARDVRISLFVSALWLLTIMFWGYMWRWESELSSERYYALLFFGPLVSSFSFLGLRWIRS